MPRFQFKQVDVFTERPFLGNPVAVVLGADEIAGEQMRQIAAWTGVPETTFVLRPSAGADYRLRIFTPGNELPFAGHPTIGTAHAVLESGFVSPDGPALRQECAAGILPLRVEGDGPGRRIFVRVPETKVVRDLGDRRAEIERILGVPVADNPAPMAIDVGPVWIVAYIEKAADVRGLTPDMAAMTRLSRELELQGITVFSLERHGDAATHIRTFAPIAGTPEDPACGSSSATIGAFLAQTGLLERTGGRYIVSSGTEVGRDGRVLVSVEDGGRRIEIGGCAVTVIDGQIEV
jgi:PhzF family phenazine biosynthesis protein